MRPPALPKRPLGRATVRPMQASRRAARPSRLPLVLLVSLLSAGCASRSTEPPRSTAPARELSPGESRDVAFASRVGREVFERDRAAWLATDAFGDREALEQSAGWLVERQEPGWLVLWLMPGADGVPSIGRRFFYDPNTDAVTEVPGSPSALSVTELQAYRARELVARALPDAQPLCGQYNLAVMPASPLGKPGWLVSALVAMPGPRIYPVGGYHEFLVSPDGERVLEQRALSKGCLDLDTSTPPPDGKLAALYVTNLIGDTPLPSHVFVSLEAKLPLLVLTTQNQELWSVDGSDIRPLGRAEQ